MKTNRIISLLLTLCMLLSMLTVIAYADEVTEDEVDTETTDAETTDGESESDDKVDATEIEITEEGMTGDGTTGNPADLASYTLASENKNLAFYVNDINGFFALVNKKTGAIWFSNPVDWESDQIAQASNREKLHSQLIVTYLNSSYDTITVASCQAHIVSEHDGDKQIFTYVFSGSTRNFSIPVCYELKEDYLNVQVLIDDIEENSDARITQITLLPLLGAGGLSDKGYALIPDGSGSLMTFNKTCKNISEYTGYVYNRDLTASSDNTSYIDLNETISLPVYGVYKNGAGYLSIITKGDGTSAIKASVSRISNSYNTVSSHFIIRDTQTRRNSTGSIGAGVYYSDKTSGNLNLRIYPLDKENSTYVGMAKKYNEYLRKEKNITKLEEDDKVVNAINIDLFCAVKSPAHFLGIPYTGVKALTTFEDVKEIIDELKASNISDITITLTGWTPGGMESAISTKLNTESKVGKVSELIELVSYAEENGVNIVLDNDVQTYYSGSSNVKKFKHTAFSLSNTPVTVYPFSKSLNRSVITGNYYHLIHPEYMVDLASEFVTNAVSKGIKNFSFKTAGTDPYAAYNKSNITTRDISTEYMSELFSKVAEQTDGIVSTKVGNSYVLGSVNNIVEAPVYSSNLILSQTSVPFYQIALRGYVNMSATAMNLSSEVSELELKCAETGLSLFYQLMDSESTEFQNTNFSDYYACCYDDYSDIMKETYYRMKKIYDSVGASEISNHEIYNNNVRITTYENGVKVYVNYGETETTVDGVKIDARSYTVVGGEK